MRFPWFPFRRKRDFERNMSEELRFHIEHQTAANIRAGMAPEEARRQARLQLGAHEGVKAECRAERRGFWLDATWANFRYALRMLRKNPGFSIVVVLTLALGIGANSAVFSALDAVLLRPLPYPNGDALTRIHQLDAKARTPETFVAPVRLEDWNRMNSTFQSITGFYLEDASEISGQLPEKMTQALVAPRFLETLGVSPALGRDFTLEEERWGGPSAALISDGLWQRRFGRDPGVTGKKLRVGNWSYTIVGVLPPASAPPLRAIDFWTVSAPDAPVAQSRESTWFYTIGRLKRGVTLAEARANLATVQAQLGRQFPKPDADLIVTVEPLKDTIVGEARQSFWILFGSVSLLLLIACTNIIALLLARATQRRHEISVRYSLGASTGAIVKQLLMEVFVLAAAGALLGLLVAGAASGVFRALAGGLPRVDEIHLDGRIVLYSLACAVAVTFLCGLLPAWRTAKSSIAGSLAKNSGTQVSSRHPIQWTLVGVQVALAVTLLAGAGLLLRSFQALGSVSPGFEPANVLTFHVSASWAETADMKALTQHIDGIIQSLANLPGAESAATAATLPGVSDKYETQLDFTDGSSDPNLKVMADSRFVSPGYFATLRIPLLAGAQCLEQPGHGTELMVNRSFASTYLAGASAVGRHLHATGQTFMPAGEIRGIVGDAREEGLSHEPEPTVYWCVSAPVPDPNYLVRTHTDPMALAQAVRQRIHEVEPGRSVFEISTLADHLDDAFSEGRLRMILLGFFAVTAISLACIGLYGTLSYSVNVRQREVGLRLALGAMRGQIAKHFLLQGVIVCLEGCAAGWGLAVASSRFLSGMLYGVAPTDLPTLAGVVVVVLAVAAAASLIPAIRAARLDPMRVLRNE
jgi:putative ABC transport system permease protein